jgi:hypothetical protein
VVKRDLPAFLRKAQESADPKKVESEKKPPIPVEISVEKAESPE